MEKKTIIVDVQTDEGVKSLNRLEASFEDVYGEIQPLTGRIGELEDQLYEMAAAGQQGTKEFQQLAQKVGEMKRTIMEVDMEVDGLSMTMGQKLGGAISGIAGGFELVQGAMGSMGVESQKVEEALLAVQSAMAMAQGVQTVKESIPAFKALATSILGTAAGQKVLNLAQVAGAKAMRILNIVMTANPIGLLIAGIAALVGAIAWFVSSTETATEKNEALNKTIDKQNKLFEKNSNSIRKNADNRKRILEAQGASEEELHQDTLRRLREEEDLRKQELKTITENLDKRRKLYRQAIDEGNEDLAREIKDQIKADKDRYNELKLNDKEYNISVLEENKKYNDELAAQEKEEQDRRNEIARAAREKREEEERIAREKRREEEKNHWLVMRDIEAFEEERRKQEEEKRLENLLVMPEIAEQQGEELVEVVGETFTRLEFIQDNWKHNFKETFNRTVGFAGDALGAIQELASAFEGKSEESQRRAFKVRKAAAIAQTTIETYKAAQSAYASQIIAGDPTSPIRGAIAATIAVASGLAKVKSIASQQFEGGGSASGGGTGAPSLPQPTAANFNIVGNSGTNQIVEGLTSAPVQAYVVSSEVTSAQSLDRNRIKTATL